MLSIVHARMTPLFLLIHARTPILPWANWFYTERCYERLMRVYAVSRVVFPLIVQG